MFILFFNSTSAVKCHGSAEDCKTEEKTCMWNRDPSSGALTGGTCSILQDATCMSKDEKTCYVVASGTKENAVASAKACDKVKSKTICEVKCGSTKCDFDTGEKMCKWTRNPNDGELSDGKCSNEQEKECVSEKGDICYVLALSKTVSADDSKKTCTKAVSTACKVKCGSSVCDSGKKTCKWTRSPADGELSNVKCSDEQEKACVSEKNDTCYLLADTKAVNKADSKADCNKVLQNKDICKVKCGSSVCNPGEKMCKWTRNKGDGELSDVKCSNEQEKACMSETKETCYVLALGKAVNKSDSKKLCDNLKDKAACKDSSTPPDGDTPPDSSTPPDGDTPKGSATLVIATSLPLLTLTLF